MIGKTPSNKNQNKLLLLLLMNEQLHDNLLEHYQKTSNLTFQTRIRLLIRQIEE